MATVALWLSITAILLSTITCYFACAAAKKADKAMEYTRHAQEHALEMGFAAHSAISKN